MQFIATTQPPMDSVLQEICIVYNVQIQLVILVHIHFGIPLKNNVKNQQRQLVIVISTIKQENVLIVIGGIILNQLKNVLK